MSAAKEDGVPSTVEEIEVIERRSKGIGNPRITEDQLRKLIDQNAANDPFPDAANDDEILEEVNVTGRKPVDPSQWWRYLLALFRRGGIGAIGIYDLPPFVIDALQESVNEVTEETLKDDDEVQDGLNQGIEEILVTAPGPGVMDPFSSNSVYKDQSFLAGIITYRQAQYKLSLMEEIKVTAKNLKNAHKHEIVWPRELIELSPIVKPFPYFVPGFRPTPQHPVEPFPGPAPKKPPAQNPTDDPADQSLPGTAPFIQGNIALTLDPNLGVRLAIRRQPARNREENKLRQDRKDQMSARIYRSILYFVNRTYGTYDELMDLWQVIGQNVYVDGVPLYSKNNPFQAMLDADSWDVDWEQMAIDYAAEQATDKAFGKMGQMSAEAQQGLNLPPGVVPLTRRGLRDYGGEEYIPDYDYYGP